ncbi:type IV pilus modification protein PilV [Halomonas organivorans]|uniref:Type IV pilus assembly protein PilV n=1 Tax=Halomonas organivorans TaxID=257772 RepID=A0A7W5BZH4_9GAMM|nr:type IV pilus modification protein PilV [Halomonas organivorans]MBB3141669.1 type IV pilus assembly protein PilV [Halomonas organivorans]
MSARSGQAKGFTLVEALVALLVLSIGLLGVAAMQLKSLQGAHAAYQRSIASLAAQDAQERLWAEMAAHWAAQQELACPGLESVNGEGGEWDDQWSSLLPDLNHTPVSLEGTCEYGITVSWEEGRFAGGGAPEFTYAVMLPGDSGEE